MTLTRKRAKPRARGTGCEAGKRCIAIGKYQAPGWEKPKRLCALHMADEMFQAQVRESLGGACWAAGDVLACSGWLEAAHIIPRRYRSVRWSFDNCKPLCQGHHWFWTLRPQEWIDYVESRGIDYWALHRRALDDPPERPADVIERLQVNA